MSVEPHADPAVKDDPGEREYGIREGVLSEKRAVRDVHQQSQQESRGKADPSGLPYAPVQHDEQCHERRRQTEPRNFAEGARARPRAPTGTTQAEMNGERERGP